MSRKLRYCTCGHPWYTHSRTAPYHCNCNTRYAPEVGLVNGVPVQLEERCLCIAFVDAKADAKVQPSERPLADSFDR